MIHSDRGPAAIMIVYFIMFCTPSLVFTRIGFVWFYTYGVA